MSVDDEMSTRLQGNARGPWYPLAAARHGLESDVD